VIEDESSKTIVGTGCVFIEQKFIHSVCVLLFHIFHGECFFTVVVHCV